MEVNQLCISGAVAEVKKARSTPAGVPISSFVMTHRSQQMEANQPRVVECEIQVQLTGQQFDEVRAQLSSGQQVEVTGALSKLSHKQPKALKILASQVLLR